eukprot:CAMPEP_0204268436 /NCGR_PEP_ID=MMETSP0468-20130131/12984_1 /ASSEMBLY_ACC=CAM_ASM_000383 /TAXON_ID=2969 /ORGANISM="Oxyrrhis marina" /LENGTH=39 /DNA_ID= /DNA_START= /DNA_END= /DNA_ORIENTATION=
MPSTPTDRTATRACNMTDVEYETIGKIWNLVLSEVSKTH